MYNLDHVNKMEGAENIPAPIKDALVDNANSSLAYKTWAGTKTMGCGLALPGGDGEGNLHSTGPLLSIYQLDMLVVSLKSGIGT